MDNIISIGDKVDIKSTKPVPKGQRPKVYASQIVDVVDFKKIKIAMPTESGHLVPLVTGGLFSVVVYSKKGMFEGNFTVVNRSKEGNIAIHILEAQTMLKKIQRRNYFRYETTMPIKYRVIAKDEQITKEEMEQVKWSDGVILDISGGGMRFVTKEEVEKGQKLQIRIVLTITEEKRELYLYADLIYVRAASAGNRLSEARVEFIKIQEPDREAIIKFIFEEQRRKRSNS